MKIGEGRRRCPGGESRRVKFVLGIKNERSVYGPYAEVVARFAKEQMQKMRRHRWVRSLRLDSLAALVKLMPVEQHGGERRQQPVRDRELVVRGILRFHATQSRAARPKNIHRMRVLGNLLEDSSQRRR